MNERYKQLARHIAIEQLFELRQGVGAAVREVAAAEADPRVARRLREIAAAFECGQRMRDLSE
jgi:hypothetical protein